MGAGARIHRIFPHRVACASRSLFRGLSQARVEGRALLLLSHVAAASFRAALAVRTPTAADRAGIPFALEGGADHHRRELRRPAVRTGLTPQRTRRILPNLVPT